MAWQNNGVSRRAAGRRETSAQKSENETSHNQPISVPTANSEENTALNKKAQYQRELLQQIEEKKQRNLQEKERKKKEDLLEIQRINREVAKEKEMDDLANRKHQRNTSAKPGHQLLAEPLHVAPQFQNPGNKFELQDHANAKINNDDFAPKYAVDTNVSKQYLKQFGSSQNAHVSTPPSFPQAHDHDEPIIPLVEVVSQVTNLEPPQVPISQVRPDVSRRYLESQKTNKTKPLTISVVKREVQGELNKQLEGLNRPDGLLYRQINQKFKEGFGEIRHDLKRANDDLIHNLERLKQETKEALISKQKALEDLDQVNREISYAKKDQKYARPFVGVDKDEIDDLIMKYGRNTPVDESNEFRGPKLRSGLAKPKHKPLYDEFNNARRQFMDNETSNRGHTMNHTEDDMHRNEGKPHKELPNRYSSQPIKPQRRDVYDTITQANGSINLDVCYNDLGADEFRASDIFRKP